MVVREKFQFDLNELQERVITLGNFANDALGKAIVALETKNVELSLEIMENDKKANVMYEEIDDFAILLIAKQAPVAIDLRRIIVAIKIGTDLERIADFATNIAKSAIRIGNQEHVEQIHYVKEMYEITSEMLRLVLEAFKEEDTQKAKHVAEMDDDVDALFSQSMKELIDFDRNNNEQLKQITQVSFTCRYLERAADHITNIAESIFYLVKGRHYDLND